MPVIALTLLTKPGCHLCDDARAVVDRVVSEVRRERVTEASDPVTEASDPVITVTESSILDDPNLTERYAEEIPVLLIDGVVHNIWRIDPERLRAALHIRTSDS